MEIPTLVWNRKNIEHIARHNVAPEEAEEICLNKPFIVMWKHMTRYSHVYG